jgi:GNAT superfamily N-acetyltransferase
MDARSRRLHVARLGGFDHRSFKESYGKGMSQEASVLIRPAEEHDRTSVRDAVERLLSELIGTTWAASSFDATYDHVLANPELGGIFVASVDDKIVGVLSFSQSFALRTGGAYLTIEELWVDPSLRGSLVGEGLVTGLKKLATVRGISDIEVGLPSPKFPGLERTERFYSRQDFNAVGPRYRFRRLVIE